MENMHFWYPASITQITEINDSFDSCMLRVCYAGKNRNRSIIPKEKIEEAIPTMAYCPIVANYDVETDTIGGHDAKVVETESGALKIINLTDAVGVIPSDPQWRWETVTEENGVQREYLCTPAILWKRTPVYDKLKRDGVTGQSMEIKVREGRLVDGLFEVDSFSFTAFCLLGDGIEPCFESAQVEVFSSNKVAERLDMMMEDFKKQFSVIAANADDNRPPVGEESFTKGGERSLDINELLQKYGLTVEDIDFETDKMTIEEIEARFAEIAKKFDEEDPADDPDTSTDATDATGEQGDDNSGESSETGSDTQDQTGEQTGGSTGSTTDGAADQGDGDGEDDETPAPDDNDDAPGGTVKRNFKLTGEQLGCGIRNALDAVTYVDEWGEWNRYGYVDYDPETGEVYAYDYIDWNLYGFSYSMNGDNVVIDFESKKRKKFAFVDFDMGDAQFSYKALVDGVNTKIAAMANEVTTLREFKHQVETADRAEKEKVVFDKFDDLADNVEFIELKNRCSEMSIQDIEEKCYAIRGRNMPTKFSFDNTRRVRLPVESGHKNAGEPYNGVFLEFGLGK